jgi:hypothetical protein
VATHRSIRSVSLGLDSFIHFSAWRAITASTSAMTVSSTLWVRAMIVKTIRKSITPRANTVATAGSRSHKARP